jgi:hypothetical protein
MYRYHHAGGRPPVSRRRREREERGDKAIKIVGVKTPRRDGERYARGWSRCRWCRALTFLAGNPDGYTKAILLARGFSLALTASLIGARLAIDRMPKRPGRGRVARVRITEAGRQALADHGMTSL